MQSILTGEKYFKHDVVTAIILYSLITLLFFYPVLGSLSSFLIGPSSDNAQSYWNMWWAEKVMADPDLSLSYSNYIFYPEGTSLIYHSLSFYNIFLSSILRNFLNPVITYNLLILLTFPFAGLSAFLLIKYLIRNSYLALAGGYIFAFNSSHFGHSLYHINIASIQFIPLVVLFFIKSVKGNSKFDLFLAALFFFLNSICSWNYLIFALYFVGFSYLYLMLRRKQVFLPGIISKTVVIAGATVLILSPWLWKMIIIKQDFPLDVAISGYNKYVTDCIALFVPPPYHLLGNLKIIQNLNGKFTGDVLVNPVYLGIASMVISIFAVKKIIKKIKIYFWAMLAFLILSLGSHLHILGWITPITLPYAVIEHIPFLSAVRCPVRFIVFVYLFWAVIVTFALRYLAVAIKSSWKRKAILTICLLVLFFDYYLECHAITNVTLPRCYDVIKRENQHFGILDLPSAPSRIYMAYQTCHGLPIVQGAVSRKIGKSLINYLNFHNLSRQKEQLINNKVKYIVIHKKWLAGNPAINIETYKNQYALLYEDPEDITLRVY